MGRSIVGRDIAHDTTKQPSSSTTGTRLAVLRDVCYGFWHRLSAFHFCCQYVTP